MPTDEGDFLSPRGPGGFPPGSPANGLTRNREERESGKPGGSVPTSRPSLEGLAGPRVSGDAAPPLPRPCGALCYARATRRAPSLGQPGTAPCARKRAQPL
uniref:Uncharacterized protein n=1 Tax=Rangifer tarandus platyrhynchus TaxID=3082113 RepID=A0ACB0DZL1_RANTA|nr:unnamed protein product [Rangifer tarandus platyrhynchus]